ncbi:conserved hypothetical protein [Candidatus Sulfopaludibacter sp. SbA3]|nr:conserved hypothetical protein [Candidatus Sulfopaludibacter sp. SbA3]
MAGGPKWIETERYDIVAKAPRDEFIVRLPEDPRAISDDQIKTRGERLRERVRSLLAERFGLVVHPEARRQTIYLLTVARSGPKVKPVTVPGDQQGLADKGPGHVQGFAATMAMLSHRLATALETAVLDKTELTGMYDFVLDWTPDAGAASPSGLEPVQMAASAGPTLFTALQEQLGLRLEAAKGPVGVVVIDQVNRPSAN